MRIAPPDFWLGNVTMTPSLGAVQTKSRDRNYVVGATISLSSGFHLGNGLRQALAYLGQVFALLVSF
jgi:hypothetical protein